MFFLSRLWVKILFDSNASHSFIAALVVRELSLEVETLEEPLYVSSPLGTKVSVDLICQGCELEISGILLTVDLMVMDMSEFDVILGMEWLMAYRVVIAIHQAVLALHFKGISTTFYPRPCTILDGIEN